MSYTEYELDGIYQGYYHVNGIFVGDIIYHTHHISLCGFKKSKVTWA